MNKIGILGGTFNPPHNGHIALAQAAYSQLNLDKVLFMPSGISYFKAGTGVLPASERIKMTKLAIKDSEHFEIDISETLREGNTYTFETLQELNAKYNSTAEFFFISGADTLFSIEKWKNPEIIFELCTLVTVVRDDHSIADMTLKKNELKQRYNARIEFLEFNHIDISSSMLREMCKNKNSISDFVPYALNEYICRKHLYE